MHPNLKGTLADRLGNGLQNRVEQFDSARYLKEAVMNLTASFLLFILFVFAHKQRRFPSTIYTFWLVFDKKLTFLCFFFKKTIFLFGISKKCFTFANEITNAIV